MAPDDLPGAHPLQQLLCLLQAAAGPLGFGQGLLLLGQPPEGPGPPVLLSPRVTPGTASTLQPWALWEGAVGEGWVRGKKKTQKQTKKLTRALYFCYILFVSLIIDVIIRGKKKSYFYTPIKPVCPLFLSLLLAYQAESRG